VLGLEVGNHGATDVHGVRAFAYDQTIAGNVLVYDVKHRVVVHRHGLVVCHRLRRTDVVIKQRARYYATRHSILRMQEGDKCVFDSLPCLHQGWGETAVRIRIFVTQIRT